MRPDAFYNALSLLNEEDANELYGLVRRVAFKVSYVDAICKNPELREFLKNESDFRCMAVIYKRLSWRLKKEEEPPRDIKLIMNVGRAIGRKYVIEKESKVDKKKKTDKTKDKIMDNRSLTLGTSSASLATCTREPFLHSRDTQTYKT